MAKYAISDIHGYLSIYKQVKEFIKPEDTVYCLGDCGDRGPQSWETIVAIYGDPQWVYLKGNHEDMLVNALKEAKDTDGWGCDEFYLLCNNGGQSTFFDAMESKFLDQWIRELDKLPTSITIENIKGQTIHLSHAGFTPLKKDNPDLIWDRTHFVHEWPQTGYDNFYVVHGHTPINSLSDVFKKEELTYPLVYSNGHKIDIDCGVFRTGKACLLNLDTFDSKIFKV